MLCVSIGRGRHRFVIEQHRHLAEQGAKMVELRLDYIQGRVNLKRLLAERPCPVLITCRRERDGGKYAGSEDERLLLLRTAVTEGADYVDIEEDVASQIPRFGQTVRVISMHNFRQTPPNLEEIHRRMCGLDADIVKLATMANQPGDNLRMLRVVRQSPVPTVGVCMGDMGTASRILGGKFGAPFTFATFHHERSLAPGQLSFREMLDVYHYDDINADTQVYGVIADPVGHSLSPLVHNAAFRHRQINAVYVPFRVPREYLGEFIDAAHELDIRGLSVTIPHKEAVVKKLSAVDDSVRGIEAANTIVFDADERGGSRRHGYNTDYQAAMDSLDELAESQGNLREFFEEKIGLVLGAGGAARAIAYGLKRRGMQVVICNRSVDRGRDLAARLGCKAIEWRNRHSVSPHILVNCTPVGMHPNVDESPYDKHHLKPSMVVFDTVYNPENTLLVKYAREQSCQVVTGIQMFVRQAALQFRLFTGQEAPTELMHETIRRAIGPARY